MHKNYAFSLFVKQPIASPKEIRIMLTSSIIDMNPLFVTYLQFFMGFLDSLAILLFLPIMTILSEVTDNFTIIQNNSTAWF
jgi:hypothetical protein